MFDIGPAELLVLVVFAVIVFGPERLPQFARKAAQVLQYVRTMAGSAQSQLRNELGPGFENLDFADLNPKAFVRKHLLEDVDPIMADVKEDLKSMKTLGKESADDFAEQINSVKSVSAGGPGEVVANGVAHGGEEVGSHNLMTKALPQKMLVHWDRDAT